MKEEDMRSILRHERIKRKLTLGQVAKASGIKRSHYNNIELGKGNPSHEVSCAIGKYFGIIDICELFKRDGEDG
jgi:transcriptional regulator with XRE-family HTH domain